MRKHLISSAIAAITFAVSSFAQISTPGEVVDVIDGRTVVLATAAGKVTVELQYIDVPENGQPLYLLVREHLRRTVLGKVVMFRARTVSFGRTVGRLTINDIDVSQQLLRDGAAWHIPQKTTGQEQKEFEAYAATETAAKQEKRGIWSVAGIQPPWEFRAAKLENERLKEKSSTPLPNGSYKLDPATGKPKGYWGDKNPSLGDVGALFHGYNAASRTGYVTTSMLGVEQSEEEKRNNWKSGAEITYWYKEDEQKGRTGIFIITVVSNHWRFPKNNDLVLFEEKPLVIGKARRTSEKHGDEVWEKLVYQVQHNNMEKLVHGTAKLKIDDNLLELRSFAYSILYNMLQVSNPPRRQIADVSKTKR